MIKIKKFEKVGKCENMVLKEFELEPLASDARQLISNFLAFVLEPHTTGTIREMLYKKLRQWSYG